MGLFGNNNKAQAKVVVNKSGTMVKRTKFVIGANVIVYLLRQFGVDMPVELQEGLANVIATGIGLGLDYLSYRRAKAKETPEPPQE